MTTSPDPSKGCRRIGILEMASPDKDRLAHWDIFRHWLRQHGSDLHRYGLEAG